MTITPISVLYINNNPTMKSILISVFILVLAQVAIAQKIRFTDPTNEWTISHTNRSQSTHNFETSTRTFKYNGTTIRNGYRYSRFEDGSLVREDTTLNIVYIIHRNDSVERILYDYNVQEGDTISYDFSGFPIWVEHMDTVMLNGYPHKMYRVHGFNGNINNTMIEGIGNISGLTELWSYDYEYTSFGYGLVCFTNKYAAPVSDKLDFTWCRYIATNAQNIQKTDNTVHIYPQPAHSEFTIQLPTEVTGKMIIINSMGQIVYTRNVAHEASLNINGISLNTGVYYYRINSSNAKVNYSGKLLID